MGGHQDLVLAKEVLHLLDKLLGVQADAYHYRFIGVLLVVGGKGPLNGRHLVPQDVVVAAQHLLHPLIAEPSGHLGGALDVAEQDGYAAVWSGVGTQVGLLYLIQQPFNPPLYTLAGHYVGILRGSCTVVHRLGLQFGGHLRSKLPYPL